MKSTAQGPMSLNAHSTTRCAGLRDTPCSFTPYNAQYLRGKRNDCIRYLIFQLLKEGKFEQEALHNVINEYFVQEGHVEHISASGFGVMLERNCEGIWELTWEDGKRVISKAGDWHYLELPERQHGRELGEVSLCLDKLVRSYDVKRNKGSGVFSWSGAREVPSVH